MNGVVAMTGTPMDAGVDVAALDAAVGKVRAGLPSWVALPVEERAGLVHRLRRRFGDEAPGMAEAWRLAQGLEPDSHWVGDVWGGLAPFAIMIRGWESTLTRLARHERLVPPAAVGHDTQGRITVEVFPQSPTDRLLYLGFSGRVRLQPGTSSADVAAAGNALASGEFPDAGVTLLLLAGNWAYLPAADALALLIGHGCTVVMKLNPVNAYLHPALERLFVKFIDAGWLAIVEGGPEVGAHLAHHQDVDRVHMTGSTATYDALVWGTGPDAEHRRASGQRLLAKPFSAEQAGGQQSARQQAPPGHHVEGQPGLVVGGPPWRRGSSPIRASAPPGTRAPSPQPVGCARAPRVPPARSAAPSLQLRRPAARPAGPGWGRTRGTQGLRSPARRSGAAVRTRLRRRPAPRACRAGACPCRQRRAGTLDPIDAS
jgi:Aldehyde dehydrogenase family